MKLSSKKSILLIILIGFLVYSNSLFNAFLWDDEEQIVKNTLIHSITNLSHILSGQTFNTGGAGLSGYFFRPLLTLNFMFLYLFAGPNPFFFHLFQLIFHLSNAVLIFKILQTLIPKTKNSSTLNLLLSLIFLVHPGISEAVFYISSLSDVMVTFFSLLSFYLILLIPHKKIYLPLIPLLLFTAFLYKESALIFPFIFIFYIFLFQKNNLKLIFALLTLPLIYLITRFSLIGTPIQQIQFSPISEASLWQRLQTIPLEIFNYLRLIFFPKDLAISQHFVVTNPNLLNFYLPISVIILLLTLSAWTIYKTKSKLIFFGLAWFLLSLIPVLNFIPLDATIAERWLYFPFIGILISLSCLISLIPSKFSSLIPPISLISPKKASFFLLLLLIPLSLRTFSRSIDWQNGLTLYSQDIRLSPNSFELQNNLGVELFRIGKYEEAKTHFERSITLQPKWHFSYNNLGASFEQEKDLEKAKEYYQKSLDRSDYYLAYENLASLKLKTEPPRDTQVFIKSSLQKLPNNPKLYLYLSLAEYKLGALEESLASAQKSYLLNPSKESYYVVSKLQKNEPLELDF